MMKYKNQNRSIAGLRCVSISDEDKCLSGRLGEIWEVGPGRYKAFKVTPTGQEKIFSFNSKQLLRAIKRLEIPSDPEEQLVWANNPNQRYYDQTKDRK